MGSVGNTGGLAVIDTAKSSLHFGKPECRLLFRHLLSFIVMDFAQIFGRYDFQIKQMHGVFPARRREIFEVVADVLERHDFQISALFFHAFDKARIDEIRIAFRVFFVLARGDGIGFVNQIKQISAAHYNVAIAAVRIITRQLQVKAADAGISTTPNQTPIV